MSQKPKLSHARLHNGTSLTSHSHWPVTLDLNDLDATFRTHMIVHCTARVKRSVERPHERVNILHQWSSFCVCNKTTQLYLQTVQNHQRYRIGRCRPTFGLWHIGSKRCKWWMLLNIEETASATTSSSMVCWFQIVLGFLQHCLSCFCRVLFTNASIALFRVSAFCFCTAAFSRIVTLSFKNAANPSETSLKFQFHQKFQVPKMEVLDLIRLFWGWFFPSISLTYSLYRWVPPF